MKGKIKKLLAAALSLTMVAGSIVVPASVSAEDETPLKSWKFDFGASGTDAEAGYTAITPDMHYLDNDAGSRYGFIGTNEEDHKLGGRLDGFESQMGQKIELEAGGGQGLNDGIGSVGEDEYGNAGEKYYPVRFAVEVPDETYYKIKATVTTLDPEKDAVASLYTERKHPLYTQKTIKAGETETTEFTIRVTPIYYEKSDPKGAIADGMINVSVLGENTALAALEIEQVATAPTLWVLGDSTVTDGNGTLPFFPLQNYTGVGTGLTKYLPSNIAMVNEGEGGLVANDNNHWNMVSSRIKADDYLYLEYGHNHKGDGPEGYKAQLDKYYNKCHEVGANLIIVSPIERINTWNAEEKKYQHTLDGFAEAGKSYVDAKVAGGATDIAYVELNQYSLDFYNKVVADNEDDPNAIKFYFQTPKGGGTDQTHPNDAGAENLAYCFMQAAKAVTDDTQKAVLAEILSDTRGETPNLVSEEIVKGGLAGDAWPTYNPPVTYDYPLVIKSVSLDENNQFTMLKAYTQTNFANYASGVLEILDESGEIVGKYVTTDHVDNTGGVGNTDLHFAEGIILGENQTYRAYMWSCYLDKEELIPEDDGGERLSAFYTPTDVEAYLLPSENGDDVENFDFYGKASLTDNDKYKFGGSAGHNLTLGKDSNNVTYTRIMSDGAKNGAAGQGSFYIMRALENIDGGTKTTGKYMISVDLMYTSGSGLNFGLCRSTTSNSPFISDEFVAFTVGDGGTVTAHGKEIGTVSGTAWTNVTYILDMNAGTAEVSVAGGDPVTVDVPAYQTFGTPAISTLANLVIEGQKVAFDVIATNLSVAKLKESDDTATISVEIDDSQPETPTEAPTEAPTTEPTEAPTTEPEVPAPAPTDAPSARKLTVNADKEYKNAVLVVAEYNADNSLKNAVLKNIDVAAGENTIEVDAKVGSRVMLWDGFDAMKPIISAEDIVGVPEQPVLMDDDAPADSAVMGTVYVDEEGTTEKTVKKSNIVKAYAVPNEGYVFVKWVDSNGADFSTNSELDIRLYKDLTLKAQFAVQNGVDKTASYDVSANQSLVKAGAEHTITITESNVFDAAGNPVKYEKSDIAWSSDDENVTVADGVVTIPASYTIEGDTKDITITSTINGIKKNIVITVYSYEFFEDVSGGTTTAAWDGSIQTIASKNCIVFPGGSTTSTLTLPNAVSIDTDRTISFKEAWSGPNTCGQKRSLEFYDSKGTKIINEEIYYDWGSMKIGTNPVTEITAAIEKDKWNDVTITINTDKTGSLVFGSTTVPLTINAAAEDIAAIKLVSASSVPAERLLGYTDIKIK